MMPPEAIARLCHELNRAYCQLLKDDTQLPWERAPEWQRQSAILGVQFHLQALEAGREPDPAESHNKWMSQKILEGWSWGPVKDPVKKTHPCFGPFEQLPNEQKLKDHLFAGVVRSVFQAHQATLAKASPA